MEKSSYQPQIEENTAVSKLWSIIFEFVQVIFMSAAIFAITYFFLFQANQVRGTSMVPTFHNNEYLLTDKLTYSWIREPEIGDVIVFKSPENGKYDFIKRVIALPGDTVKIEFGDVYVNGQKIEEPYLADGTETKAGVFLKNGFEFTTPPDSYVVFGDNRGASSDSRDWGPVPAGNIIGRAWFRYFPLSVMGYVGDTKTWDN